MSKKENTTIPIERSEGSYQKEIVVDEKKSNAPVARRQQGKHYVFEIPIDTKITFHLKVLKASNMEATGQNVYWVAQSHKNFKTNKWLKFQKVNSNGATRYVENEKPLHEFLNHLNRGTKFEKKLLNDGTKNPHYVNYTLDSTNGVGRNYIPANPYKDRFTEREDKALYGDLNYTATKLGEGIWLEGFNYTPEHKSQGAFILAVGEPQILSFFVEKRTQQESKVKKQGITKEKQVDTEHVEQELIYGDYMDLHLRLHNVFDYIADLEIFCDDKSMDENEEEYRYLRIIPLFDKKNDDGSSLMENPSVYYNLDIIEELLTDIRWADKSDHDEGKDTEDSLQEYKMVLTLTPTKSPKYNNDNRPILKREVTFTVNYKGDFSLEEQELEYVEQVVKVKQPPLVSQSFETCNYTELVLTNGDSELTLLKEEDNGSLTEVRKDNKTPYYEFVAGNNKNKQEISIDVSSNVGDCVNEVSHIDNVFNTSSIEVYNYDKKYKNSLIGEIEKYIEGANIFENIQPFKEIQKTEKLLKFKAGYPYNAFNEDTFLIRYLTFQMTPVPLDISVQSCRYIRTPKFLIYPDVIWAVHMNYDPEKILYYDNEEVPLVEGYGDYMSYIAKGLDWINNQVKPFVESYVKGFLSKEKQKSWDTVQKMIKEFVDESVTEVSLGFHAKYDDDSSKIINYAEIQPYKFALNYMIFQMVLISIALDLLMIYLTRGKVSPGLMKAARAAKKFKKFQKRVDAFKDKYNLSFLMPKMSVNFAIHREQQPDFGEVATIFEYTMRANPFLGISTEYEFVPEQLPKALKKFEIKAVVKGEIAFDINIRFNTLTKEFTLNNNASDQKAGGCDVLKDGDIIQMQGRIALELEAKGKYKDDFELWDFLPVSVEAEGEVELHSAAGITRRFGVHKTRGPYLEDKLFFDGIKGKYKQKLKVEIADREVFDSNPKNEEEPIPVFGQKTISLGTMYLFEMFTLKKTYS